MDQVNIVDQKKIVSKLEMYVNRRSLIAFIVISFLTLVSAVIIYSNQTSQQKMLKVSSITYDQRILLQEVSDQVLYLLKSSERSTSVRFIKNVQKDISNTLDKLHKNQKSLHNISYDESNSINSWLNYACLSCEYEAVITKISHNLKEMTVVLKQIVQADPKIIKDGFEFWNPNFLLMSRDGIHAKEMSELNSEVYAKAIQHNKKLANLQIYLFFIVLTGIWLVWVYVLKPLSKQVNSQFNTIQEKQEKLRYQARYDSLSGLMNRLSFNAITERLDSQGKYLSNNISAVYIDLDNFKITNDTFGHPVGDLVLKEVADRLLLSTANSDQVFRLGGDEFAIIFSDLNTKDEIEARIKNISKVCCQPIEVEEREVPISVSIGVACQFKGNNTVKDLFSLADAALYKVKNKGGKNYAIYSDSDEITLSEQIKISKELDNALKNKEIEIYYQPIVRISDNKITGLEALARWNHPEKGILPANSWLNDSKSTRFLSDVSVYALEQIEADIKKWSEMDIDHLQISVNATENLLISGTMLDSISNIMSRLKTNNQFSIAVEIPESIILDRNINLIIEQLKIMRKKGLKILLDDFGTGYATLSHLIKLPFDSIKIDKQFCHAATDCERHGSIIKAIQGIAIDMNKSLICEGVESAKSLDKLNTMGCEYVQGFYYSPAVCFEDISKLLKKKQLNSYIEV